MKRICYLLTFFLTGFSIAANQESLRNTYLVTVNEEFHKIELRNNPTCDAYSINNKVIAPSFLSEKLKTIPNLICCIRN